MSDTTEPEVDLEKQRDDKCIPIAREMLNDLASDLIPVDANVKVDYNPLITKFLKRSLDADLNITTEVSYLFQLVLGALAGLNTAVQSCATVLIDENRYGNIARKILELVAKGNIRIGNVTPEESAADFAPIKDELNLIFAQEKLTMLELKYIMDSIFEHFKNVNNNFQGSLEQSSAKAESKLFGIESMTDLTMKRLNDVLIAPMAPVSAPEIPVKATEVKE